MDHHYWGRDTVPTDIRTVDTLSKTEGLTPSIPPLVSMLTTLMPSGKINLPSSRSAFSLSAICSGVSLAVFGGGKEGYEAKISLTSPRRAEERIGVALD